MRLPIKVCNVYVFLKPPSLNHLSSLGLNLARGTTLNIVTQQENFPYSFFIILISYSYPFSIPSLHIGYFWLILLTFFFVCFNNLVRSRVNLFNRLCHAFTLALNLLLPLFLSDLKDSLVAHHFK